MVGSVSGLLEAKLTLSVLRDAHACNFPLGGCIVYILFRASLQSVQILGSEGLAYESPEGTDFIIGLGLAVS